MANRSQWAVLHITSVRPTALLGEGKNRKIGTWMYLGSLKRSCAVFFCWVVRIGYIAMYRIRSLLVELRGFHFGCVEMRLAINWMNLGPKPRYLALEVLVLRYLRIPIHRAMNIQTESSLLIVGWLGSPPF